MTHLYKLEKATIEMIAVMSQVMSLSEKFEQQWSLKSRYAHRYTGRCHTTA